MSSLSRQHDPIYDSLPLRSHLRETRLFVLESGEWEDRIRCKLEVVSLGSNPQFEALSYVWGDSPGLKSISLNEHSIDVGANLESALRRLRKPNETRALWADGVCVNQKNVRERNEQVSMMRDIYFHCQRVLIWLGPAHGLRSQHRDQMPSGEWATVSKNLLDQSLTYGYSEHNIASFQSKLDAYYLLPFALRHSEPIDSTLGTFCLVSLLAQNKHINSTDIPFLSNHDAHHRFVLRLEEIMNCPWWTRQWVIQEIVLPDKATVYYGKFTVPWELFAHAARNYEHHRKECCARHYTYLPWSDVRILERFSRTIVELDNLRQEWQKILAGDGGIVPISLRQLLWQFRERVTSDPRDKIYSLLPLVNHWGKQMHLSPDYNWTSQQLYRATVEKIVAVDESLLVFMGTNEKALPGLPSWVPDWTRKPAKHELERLERAQIFAASGKIKPQVRFIEESFMEIASVPFDEVTTVADTMNFSDEEGTHQIFASWYALLCRDQSITSNYPTGETRAEAYWRTLCTNTVRTLGREEASINKRQRYRKCSEHYARISRQMWMNDEGLPLDGTARTDTSGLNDQSGISNTNTQVNGEQTHEADLPTEPVFEEQLNYIAVDFAIASATTNRRLFFTSSGYMGLGPATLAEGDLVYVLSGGSMPFAIRRAGERKIPGSSTHVCYQLLGDCYVHGIMDGELMQDYESAKKYIYLL